MSAKDKTYRLWLKVAKVVGPGFLAVNARGRRGYHRGVVGDARLSAYCVMRHRNADHVRAFVESLPPGATVHLHALDAPAASVLHLTRSSGPGARMPLLQGLLDEHPPRPGDWVVVFDDDVTFVGTGGRRFVGYCATAELDIAQPAHAPGSHSTFVVTRAVPLSTARETTFVEVGPVVAFSSRAQARVLPFPAEARMGWGLDVSWSLLRGDGLRLGIVDATPVVHHGPVGSAYDSSAEEEFQKPFLERAGVTSSHELAGNVGRTWRPWERGPRWACAARTGRPGTDA